MKTILKNICRACFLITVFFVFNIRIFPQTTSVDFSSDKWDKSRAKIVEHLGRQSLVGNAFLKDLEFKNGIVEIDIATLEKTRSYPGVTFRLKDSGNYERVYIRPHRSPLYDDALQYAPMFNGVDSWQLYYGTGKTSELDIKAGVWNHLKIVFAGDQAQIFWNDAVEPALIIEPLVHGEGSGSVGLVGPMDGSAFYSNFSYEIKESLTLQKLVPHETVVGAISDWKLSDPLKFNEIIFTKYPDAEMLNRLRWQPVKSNSEGLVDISRYHSRNSRVGDCVLAKTTIKSDKDTLMRIGFGYSDYITVFINNVPVFFGNSAYQSRDKSFLGVVGYNDNIFLPLKKGDNELMALIGESMGGWGFCFRREDEIFMNPSLKKVWTIKDSLSWPESIVYDPNNNLCYVSNYFNDGNEYISKISLNGEMIEKEWIKGIRMPSGLCCRDNKLYAVTRTELIILDVSSAKIIESIPLTGLTGPNDVAVSEDGDIYVSDMPGNSVYKYSNKKFEPWLEGLNNANGLLFVDGNLLVGENEKLLIVNTSDKSIKTVVELERGSNVDGVQIDGKGNYLISDFHGKLYHVSLSGKKQLLLDTSTPGDYTADFLFIKEKNLLIVPTMVSNSINAYMVD